MPLTQRSKLTALYLAGVLSLDSRDETQKCIQEYINSSNLYYRSIKIVKEKGNTFAFKLITKERHADDFVKDGFWPKGITCRKWVDYNTSY